MHVANLSRWVEGTHLYEFADQRSTCARDAAIVGEQRRWVILRPIFISVIPTRVPTACGVDPRTQTCIHTHMHVDTCIKGVRRLR